MALVAFIALALVLALGASKLLNRRGGPVARATDTTVTSPDDPQVTARPTTTTTSPDSIERNGPAMQLYPQRARAGPPLELMVRGNGCAGGTGVLSITQLGAARDTGNVDRLVVRRRIDVAADGTWSTQPLLVGQPPGTYRVDASCPRRAVTDQVGVDVDRRDLFTATEVLELTAPATVDSFDVTPPFATPGVALTVVISGSRGCPPSTSAGTSSVSGVVIPNAGATGAPQPFSATVDGQGHWQAQVTFDASEATGSYSVSATCSAGFAFGDQLIRFMDTSDIVVPPIFPWTTTPPPGPGGAPAPIPGQPSYTG